MAAFSSPERYRHFYRPTHLQPCGRRLLMRESLYRRRIAFLLYGRRGCGGGEGLYAIQRNAIHSATQQNIYLFTLQMPFWSAESLEREKCIKPLTVFTCVGLMLMCEGRPEDGGWEIDHWRMSVRGNLDIHNCLFTLLSSGESIKQRPRCHRRQQLLTA